MRALTVRQPYANLIVSGAKTIENRGRLTGVRGLVVIHAGKQVHERYRGATAAEAYDMPPLSPLGEFVGVARIDSSHKALSADCYEHECYSNPHAEFPTDTLSTLAAPIFHWVLVDALQFTERGPAANGSLGFWEPTHSDEHLINLAIVEATKKMRGNS